MKRKLSLILFGIGFIVFQSSLQGQQTELSVSLEPLVIPEIGGLQSYVIGQHEGKWLIFGGRLDGLHRRQPWASFNQDGKNNVIIVADPEKKQVWKAPLFGTTADVIDQMSSSNMQFNQSDELLVVTGGYGFSSTLNDHTTFPSLLIINVPGIIESIISRNTYQQHIHQIRDDKMAVTGGRMLKIEDTFYLVGGQKFVGRYNPMGPDHGPGFVQEYTHEIRPFKIEGQGIQSKIIHLDPIHDERHLRRRDYNLVPYLLGGKEGFMIFSGVFQKYADIPWLSPVFFHNGQLIAMENFTQHLNHYHCPVLPIYDYEHDIMYTLFFGGIAQFYPDDEVIVQDNEVPFVKSIGMIKHTGERELQEIILNSSMPGFLGAGAEFIPSKNLSVYNNGVVKMEEIKSKTFIGYIYGGIKSSRDNIFWINDGSQSEAHPNIYKVYLSKNSNPTSSKLLSGIYQVYPNLETGLFTIIGNRPIENELQLRIYDPSGQMIYSDTPTESTSTNLKAIYKVQLKTKLSPGTYTIDLINGTKRKVQKVIVRE